MDKFSKLMIASGVAGFSATLELLKVLNTSGVISDEDLLEIWDRALASMEALDAVRKHEISRLARELLEAQLINCRKARA
jgi:hypothetical protein